jgi:hypothetical protein
LDELSLVENSTCAGKDIKGTSDATQTIQDILSRVSDGEITFRLLQREDYGRGIMSVLGQLTIVGDVT